MAQKGTTTATSLRVRAAPVDGVRLGALPRGTPVDIVETANGWHRIRLYPDRQARAEVYGWVSGEYVALDRQPALPGGVRVGLNVLARHAEVALPAARRGCRHFLIFNDITFAQRIKSDFPDAVVMVRHYWDRNVPTIDRYFDVMDGCRDPRLVYTGLNEADEMGQGGSGGNLRVDELRRRAEFDIAIATRIRATSNAVYAAGTFSMGTPDFTQPAICDAMRRYYAPHYNSGLISWDHHLYSPDMSFGPAPRIVETLTHTSSAVIGRGKAEATWQVEEASAGWVDPIWFETRWRFLFTRCGFNPSSTSRVYCSETGVDEGGVGGFPAHGATKADVSRWAQFFINEQSRPLTIDGAEYASPFVGGAIFQAGNTWDWAGYNVEGYMDALAETWT